MAANCNGAASSDSSDRQTVQSHLFGDPAYTKLSRINGDFNKMTRDQIKEKLARLHLDTRGQKDVLKKRLKSYFKRKYISQPGVARVKQPDYKYYIVIDFEATCEQNSLHYPHEIIEFPAVLVNAADGSVVDEFQSFVRPTRNTRLTEFCRTLTNITQEQVNTSDTFPEVLHEMENWMKSHQLGKENRFAVVTDGPWDMSRFLHMQCLTSDIAYPRWAKRWVNIRKIFCNAYHVSRAGVSMMLEVLGLAFEGRPHSGIDDSRNIARILAQLIADGSNIYENEKLLIHTTVPVKTGLSDDTQDAEVAILQSADADSQDDEDIVENTSETGQTVAKSNSQREPVTNQSTEDLSDAETGNCAAALKQLSI